jgi:hypothetical protein
MDGTFYGPTVESSEKSSLCLCDSVASHVSKRSVRLQPDP